MLPTVAQIIARASALPAKPKAIEAFWDGDTTGWFLVLVAILEGGGPNHPRYSEHDLAVLREESGDLRLFNRHVPPWPESTLAQQAGEAVAKRLGVPFFFPSPQEPDDECVRWWSRDEGHPCKVCGKRLSQRDTVPWFGTCHPCHRRAEDCQPHLKVQLLPGNLSEPEYQRIGDLIHRALDPLELGEEIGGCLVEGDQYISLRVRDRRLACEAVLAALAKADLLGSVCVFASDTASSIREQIWPTGE